MARKTTRRNDPPELRALYTVKEGDTMPGPRDRLGSVKGCLVRTGSHATPHRSLRARRPKVSAGSSATAGSGTTATTALEN